MHAIEEFNETHRLGHVLKKTRAAKGVPKDFEEVDLRFLRRVYYADTYNGVGCPVTGLECTIVLYGNKIAWQRVDQYHDCGRGPGLDVGNPDYRRWYHAAALYLVILEVSQKLFLRESINEKQNDIYVNERDLDLLKKHPQYKELVRDFGLELKPAGKSSNYEVIVSKFYEK